ncbi:hypothetical protein [Qipengyuania sp. MTN3-11]|uniref:hypothetical protein n=1 Tax=Qipengyuania sp. MTN3-11 TaxID=3056557 RepID=UPI0036F2784E
MMPILRSILAAALAGSAISPGAAEAPPASAWEIGPFIDGRNYSVGMPVRPADTREGASFVIPGPTAADGHVHYVTTPVRSLAGAKRITLRYRIDAPRGTRFVQQENPGAGPATLSLYFQRRGDSWRARHPDYRWYSPVARQVPLSPGVHEVSIPLAEDERWIAMMGSDSATNPRGFAAAIEDAHRVGFTFGGSSGRGHGVYATNPARFTVLDFRIE